MRGKEKEDHWKSFKTAASTMVTLADWLAMCSLGFFHFKVSICYTFLLDSGHQNHFELLQC